MSNDFDNLLENYKVGEEEKRGSKRAREENGLLPEWARRPPLNSNERHFRSALMEGAKIARKNIMERKRNKDEKKNRELAVCILCIDGIPFEKIWQHWAERCEKEANIKIMFYIHAHKRQVAESSSEWVRKHLIKDHFLTPWGSVELCRAASALFVRALKDNDGDLEFAALASETCLPIASPDQVADELFNNDSCNSWIAAFDKPDNGYAVDKQWNALSNALPLACTWKAPQWILLSRDHARLISMGLPIEVGSYYHADREKHQLWRLFSKTTAADELYFPSLLAVCGELEREPNTPNSSDPHSSGVLAPRISRRRLTYCDWTARGRSPATLHEFTPEIISIARTEGCLFARKFVPSACLDTNQWENAMRIASSNNIPSSQPATLNHSPTGRYPHTHTPEEEDVEPVDVPHQIKNNDARPVDEQEDAEDVIMNDTTTVL
mmetsp:Transcript_17137/g.22246  ORF Transcript_17137/g.22246 Transcript_17137/m.22246 type:complete len:439 (+) Transcript_17137:48-1364(+)